MYAPWLKKKNVQHKFHFEATDKVVMPLIFGATYFHFHGSQTSNIFLVIYLVIYFWDKVDQQYQNEYLFL